MKRTNIARARIFALATTVAACAQHDPASPVMSAAPPPRGAVSMSDSVQDLHGLELEWYNAGSVVPGFAGMYFDSSQTLLVTGTAPTHATAAISRATQILASTGRRLTTTRFRQVKYDFRSLATWRQAVRDTVMSIDGIQSMDIDEAANMITVGAANADAEARALIVAANAGIPKDAFGTFRQAAISPMTELGDNIRPLTGGTRYGGQVHEGV